MTKEEYNNEPVFYCSHCLSLKVKKLDGLDMDICSDCGNTDIKQTNIDDWNILYTKEYGNLFLEESEYEEY